ncbi:MAG: tetratricopeptide repeat protein [Nitrospirae bacterium]|nr:tetratricopeptide repeat protein [Nitrospirota bacterium]
MENYKKWLIVLIATATAVFVIVSFVTKQSYSPEEPVRYTQEQTAVPPVAPGPIVEQDLNKVVPVEELGVDTKNPKELALLGDKYFESSKFNQAIELYKKVLELDPRDIDTYNDLGLAYQYVNRPDLAVDILQKGVKAGPSNQRIWLSLGFVNMSAGNNAEAKTALKKAVELNPQTDIGQEAMRMLGLIK